MLFRLTLFFSLFCSFSSFSQTPATALVGRWESPGKRLDSSLVSKQSTVIKQVIVFNEDRTFRRDILFRATAKSKIDTARLDGYYKVDQKKSKVLFTSDFEEEQDRKAITPPSYTSRFQLLNDSTLSILNNVYTKKRRFDGNPYGKILEAADSDFYLQNLKNADKKVKVRKDQIMLMVNESKRKGDHVSRFNTTFCFLAALKKDSVIVRLVSEETDIEYRDHYSTINSNYLQDVGSRKYKAIAMNDISYINMKSPARKGFNTFGRVIMGASILTILASPIAAATKPESERTATREKVFFLGLSGLVVSIPFFVLGKNKKYGISKTYATKSRNYWQIKLE